MLHFADDTLFLCQVETHNILVIKSIIRCFKFALGLKVDFYRSKLGGIGVDHYTLDRFSIMVNCNKMMKPFTYL